MTHDEWMEAQLVVAEGALFDRKHHSLMRNALEDVGNAPPEFAVWGKLYLSILVSGYSPEEGNTVGGVRQSSGLPQWSPNDIEGEGT